LSAIILISGEEEFLVERAAIDEARSLLPDRVCHYDESEIGSYLEESQMMALFGETRVFVLHNVTKIPRLPVLDSDSLILLSKKKLKCAKATRSLHFPKFKTFGSNNQVVKWIIDEGNRINIDLSDVAGALFVSNGKSLRKIASEIQKLSVLVPSGGHVTPDVAKSVMSFSAELTPKDIVNSICQGLAARAILVYDKLQEKAEEAGWIIAYLQRHVIQYLKIEMLIQAGTAEDQIANMLGVKPYFYRNFLAPHAGLWSIASLSQSLETLCDLDIAHKRGSAFARFGLQLEIIRLSEEARDND